MNIVYNLLASLWRYDDRGHPSPDGKFILREVALLVAIDFHELPPARRRDGFRAYVLGGITVGVVWIFSAIVAHADAPGPGDAFADLVCNPITGAPITLAPQGWAGAPITYANTLPDPARGLIPTTPTPTGGGGGSTTPPEEPPLAPVDGPWAWANLAGGLSLLFGGIGGAGAIARRVA